MSEYYSRIVVIHDKTNHTFDVIEERVGKQPVTLWFSQKEDGEENPLPYKNMKEMIRSITKELKNMNKQTDPVTILRYVFQLYRIGTTEPARQSVLENIYSKLPAPGIFDNTWETWKSLTREEKQTILVQLETYFTDVDSWWYETLQHEPKKQTTPQTDPIKQAKLIEAELSDNRILIKAAKLASAGIISVALFKKLFDLYQSRASNEKKTSERRVSIKSQLKKRFTEKKAIRHKSSKYKHHKKHKHSS